MGLTDSVIGTSVIEPNWNQSMNLSVKNVPEDLVQRLRARAAHHHRSLQGELLAIIEEAVQPASPISAAELLAKVRELGLPSASESTAWIREARDGR